MNIIYLNTHDTGRFIEPYGAPVPTPNLMRLAKNGVLFRNAFCAAPTCSPSRAGLLIGQAPHNNGMWGLTHRGFSLLHPEQHLAAFLAKQGLETALCGVQHEAEEPNILGYQTVLDAQDYHMGRCDREWREFDIANAKLAADYIQKNHSKPFFLSLGLFNTHRRFPALSDDAAADYVMPPFPIADTRENRREMAAYIESAAIADECTGIVMEALQKSGRDKDTLLFFTTDHGIDFPEMKCTLYDTGIGVSLIIKLPERAVPKEPGKCRGWVSDALVSQLDIFPTLCELLDLKPPERLQGFSLLPLLRRQQKEIRDEIFAEISYHVAYEPVRCIRTREFKYIRRYGSYLKGIPSNVGDCLDKSRRLESGFYDQPRPREYLFDLSNDPIERINLADDKQFSEVLVDLSRRLDAWLEKTDDPVRRGTMIPPDGVKVNYPDSKSPSEKIFIDDWTKLR
jgi:arylsulfatase A-like enzyme